MYVDKKNKNKLVNMNKKYYYLLLETEVELRVELYSLMLMNKNEKLINSIEKIISFNLFTNRKQNYLFSEWRYIKSYSFQ